MVEVFCIPVSKQSFTLTVLKTSLLIISQLKQLWSLIIIQAYVNKNGKDTSINWNYRYFRPVIVTILEITALQKSEISRNQFKDPFHVVFKETLRSWIYYKCSLIWQQTLFLLTCQLITTEMLIIKQQNGQTRHRIRQKLFLLISFKLDSFICILKIN